MGQTWVVVAIVAGLGLALYLFFRTREEMAPPEKGAPKPAKDGKPAEKGEEKTPSPAPASSGKPSVTDKASVLRAPTVREPAMQRKAAIAKIHEDEEDDDITIVTLAPRFEGGEGLPNAGDLVSDDEDQGDPDSERPGAVPIIYDQEAAEDEPTRAHAVILVSAVGQTDLGQKRKINEDRYLVLDDHQLYVVADGMGGHAGGEVASQCAVDTISAAFKEGKFQGTPYDNVPRRGGELALAIQMANAAIFEKQKKEPKLAGMGTTIVSARFTPGKERVYIGHVGDSRCYRFRAGQLTQITTDHTMAAIGMTGPFADHLSRAVGIGPAVKVDLVIAKPRHDDVFLLCSDGLSKMVKDDVIREVLSTMTDPNEAIAQLVERANAGGGRDNITVILVVVKDPQGFARYLLSTKKKAAEAAARAEADSAATGEQRVRSPEEERVTEPGAPPAELKSLAEERVTVPVAEPEAMASALDAKVAEPEARAAGAEAKAGDTGSSQAVSDVKPRPSVPEQKASENGSAASSGEVKARPSVPPRPEPRASVPPPRPSVSEPRKSVSDGRPSVPEQRPSIPEQRLSVPEAPATDPKRVLKLSEPPPTIEVSPISSGDFEGDPAKPASERGSESGPPSKRSKKKK